MATIVSALIRSRMLLWVLLIVLPIPVRALGTEPASPELRLGEAIYRKGILPSGKPLQARVKGESSLPGTTFACASCHLRSGLGATEENVYTPPVTGNKLFAPRQILYKGRYAVSALRPAYTEEALAAALRDGVDPTGKRLADTMPRYPLTDDEVRVLIAYLKDLSSRYSPGVTDTTIHFATVITEEVSQQEREALINPLVQYVNMKNSQLRTPAGRYAARRSTSRLMAENMVASADLARKQMSLTVWLLKGAPETWRAQLEEYNRKEPVFALLGGISHRDWQPVHRFSEEHGIPCLLPATDFPVVADTDWYTLYLSKGYYQEGEGAARYLDETTKGKKVLQVMRDSAQGRALAAGFGRSWRERGNAAPTTLTLEGEQALTEKDLAAALSREKPAVLVVWDGAAALPALESLAQRKGRPEYVLLSSRYLGSDAWSLNEALRGFTYLTYPFSFSAYQPRVAGMGGVAKQPQPGDVKTTLRRGEVPLKDRVQTVAALTKSLTELLTAALMDLKDNYYRDGLLDVIGVMMEQPYPLYGRLGFSASDRYGARGCYIVQLSPGSDPQLVKKTGWDE